MSVNLKLVVPHQISDLRIFVGLFTCYAIIEGRGGANYSQIITFDFRGIRDLHIFVNVSKILGNHFISDYQSFVRIKM